MPSPFDMASITPFDLLRPAAALPSPQLDKTSNKDASRVLSLKSRAEAFPFSPPLSVPQDSRLATQDRCSSVLSCPLPSNKQEKPRPQLPKTSNNDTPSPLHPLSSIYHLAFIICHTAFSRTLPPFLTSPRPALARKLPLLTLTDPYPRTNMPLAQNPSLIPYQISSLFLFRSKSALVQALASSKVAFALGEPRAPSLVLRAGAKRPALLCALFAHQRAGRIPSFPPLPISLRQSPTAPLRAAGPSRPRGSGGREAPQAFAVAVAPAVALAVPPADLWSSVSASSPPGFPPFCLSETPRGATMTF